MSRRKSRATAISISLPQELATAIETRVQSGLYGSASELVREALRRFFCAPDGFFAPDQLTAPAGPGARNQAAEPTGNWRSGPIAAATPAPANVEHDAARERRRRLERALDELETDDVIRLAPERLQRLRDAHSPRPPG